MTCARASAVITMDTKLFMIVCLQFVHGSLMKSPDDLPIKYPGPTKVPPHYDVDIPEECQNQNFCTIKPPNYPQEEFDKMFVGSRLGKLPNLVIPNESEVPVTVDVSNRQGGPGEKDDCRASVTYEPLYRVRSKRDGQWRVVVNSEKESYVQKIRLETCLKPGSKCFKPFPEPVGFETFCKQKYNDWEIVVSDGKGGTETITTSLPVCCSCFYRSVDLPSRFGKPSN